MEGLAFRRAVEADKDNILAIAAQIWEGEDYLPDVIDDWLAPGPAQLIVAAVQDRVVGLGRLYPLLPGFVWFEGLRVDPAYQGHGVAKALTGHMVQMADQAGAELIALSTYIDNYASQRVSAAFGFIPAIGFVYLDGKVEDLKAYAARSPRAVDISQEEAASFIRRSDALAAGKGYLPHGWRFMPFERGPESALAHMAQIVGIKEGAQLVALLCCGDHCVHGPASFSIDFLEGSAEEMAELARHALTFIQHERYLEAMVPCQDGRALPSLDALLGAGFKTWNEGQPDVFVYERHQTP